MASDLPCGCRRGCFLCAEAERLWAATGHTYRLASRTQDPADWAAYDDAVRSYYQHFGEMPPGEEAIPQAD